jgi:hypothetical protein
MQEQTRRLLGNQSDMMRLLVETNRVLHLTRSR